MKKIELKDQFVEMRAAGISFAEIAEKLGVSKQTLISWSKELSREIHNARTMRTDALFEKYKVAKTARIEFFGDQLAGIFGELKKRDLGEVATPELMKQAVRIGEFLRDESEPLFFEGEEETFQFSKFAPETWPA